MFSKISKSQRRRTCEFSFHTATNRTLVYYISPYTYIKICAKYTVVDFMQKIYNICVFSRKILMQQRIIETARLGELESGICRITTLDGLYVSALGIGIADKVF